MKLYAITLGLTLAVQFVRAEDIGTEIDRLTAYGEGWWKDSSTVTSLCDRVTQTVIREPNRERQRVLATQLFDWAISLPVDWHGAMSQIYGTEKITLLGRVLEIPALHTNKTVFLEYATFVGKMKDEAERYKRQWKEEKEHLRKHPPWTENHAKGQFFIHSGPLDSPESRRLLNSHRSMEQVIGIASSFIPRLAMRLGEIITDEEREWFTHEVRNSARLNEQDYREVKYRLEIGSRVARERTEREKAIWTAVSEFEAIPATSWYENHERLEQSIQCMARLFSHCDEKEHGQNIPAKRVYNRVMSFPVEWTTVYAPFQIDGKLKLLGLVRRLCPLMADEALALDLAVYVADVHIRLSALELGDSNRGLSTSESRTLRLARELRYNLQTWKFLWHLAGFASSVYFWKKPAERAAFLEKYAAAARLSPEEKRKLLAEVLATIPKPTEPEKPVAN
ncbi:MAG: hypothetical protein IJR99_09415 [Kiritimatiellae bacterium]|nr:hypothetical protein [Kiritimatiellia bacterium]